MLRSLRKKGKSIFLVLFGFFLTTMLAVSVSTTCSVAGVFRRMELLMPIVVHSLELIWQGRLGRPCLCHRHHKRNGLWMHPPPLHLKVSRPSIRFSPYHHDFQFRVMIPSLDPVGRRLTCLCGPSFFFCFLTIGHWNHSVNPVLEYVFFFSLNFFLSAG